MTAGVGEDHEAEGGAALAARAIQPRSPFLRRGDVGGAQNAAQGLAAEGKAFVFDQLLMQVGIVESGIAGASQLDHLLASLVGQRPGLWMSGVAVHQPSDGVGLIAALKTLHLSFTALQ